MKQCSFGTETWPSAFLIPYSNTLAKVYVKWMLGIPWGKKKSLIGRMDQEEWTNINLIIIYSTHFLCLCLWQSLDTRRDNHGVSREWFFLYCCRIHHDVCWFLFHSEAFHFLYFMCCLRINARKPIVPVGFLFLLVFFLENSLFKLFLLLDLHFLWNGIHLGTISRTEDICILVDIVNYQLNHI